MASEKKRRGQAPDRLNSPFAKALKGMKAPKSAAAPKGKSPPAPARSAVAKARSPASQQARPESARPESALPDYGYEDRVAYTQAYAGVQPLDGNPDASKGSKGTKRRKGTKRLSQRVEQTAPEVVPGAEDAAARARLDALVGGGVRFDIRYTGDGGVEGLRQGLHSKHLRALRQITAEPSRRCDLHGLRAEVAVTRVGRFVREACRDGERVVLIVHGKGKHSPGGVGVLAECVVEALSTGGAAPVVTAFVSAPERLGGAGALLVRLGDAR